MEVQSVSFADTGLKELVAFADPILNISEQAVSERYTLGGEIGCGSYGRALLAHRKEDGLQVVVKQIRLLDMDDKARLDTLTEAKLLAQFNHVNIVHYYECLLEGGVLNIVMEYANGGDLADTIQRRQREKKPFSEDEIMFWFVQVVLALYHVHGKKVLHRDLKSQNIFMAEGNLLKLGDFGIARVLNSDTELARTVIGTPYYLSPEICEDRPYNRKSDVWSLGCVLYELATLRRAFDGHSLPALVVKILHGKYPPVSSRYSSGLRGLIEAMLKQNPKDRPSADAILRSDFVRPHVERYAAHVMSLGLGPGHSDQGAADGSGSGSAAAAAAALGLVEWTAAAARPRPSPAVHRTPRPPPARPPRVPTGAGGTPGPPAPPCCPAPSPAAAPGAVGLAAGPAGPGEGESAAGDQERSSSYDVSEVETASSTPAEGCSPSKAAVPAGRRRGLVPAAWVRRQQAALAQLAGALGAQKAGGAGGLPAGADAGEGPGSGDGGGQEAGLAGPAGGDVGANATAAVGGAGATAAKAKLAELRLQRDAELEVQRRAVLARREQQKAAAVQRMHKAAVVGRDRAVERQRAVERHLAEQKAEVEAKAAKAMQLAAAIKNKEEARRREQEVAAQHLHAHREHLRAIKSHISKEQLSELGSQFKARMANALSAGACGGGESAVGSAQVLVVDFGGAAGTTEASPARGGVGGGRAAVDRHGGAFPARRRSAGQVAGSVGTACAVRRASGGNQGDGGLGVPDRGKPLADPPWKQRHRPGKSVDFPDVQIFTPFGSETASPPQGTANEGAEGGTEGEGEEDSGGASTPDEEDQQAAAGVLEVLAQIHTVLEEQDEGDSEADSCGAAPDCSSRSRVRIHCPSDDEEDDGARGTSGATNRHSQSTTAASAAAANAHKTEQLRMELEQQLGSTSFLAAYQCLRELQDRADDGDTDGGGNGGAGGGGSTLMTQDQLQGILGSKGHLARLLQKLVTLEDAVFA